MPDSTVLYAVSLVLLILLGIFGLYLPDRLSKKKKKEYLAGLKRGDKVETLHGIKGRIVSVNEDTLIIRTEPDDVRFEIAKWGLKNK